MSPEDQAIVKRVACTLIDAHKDDRPDLLLPALLHAAAVLLAFHARDEGHLLDGVTMALEGFRTCAADAFTNKQRKLASRRKRR